MPVVQHKDLPQSELHPNKIDATTGTELTPASLTILDARYAGVGEGGVSPVSSEVPIGAINGVNVTFTLANTPVAGSTRVYLNGLRQKPGAGNSYVESANTIVFSEAPLAGDEILVDYFE